MHHRLLREADFWEFLLTVDQDLADAACQEGCSCGGRLHCAKYPRKPRGGPADLPPKYGYRLSFCCDRDGCRKRLTPPSVRFLGRKVYLRRSGRPGRRYAAGTHAPACPRTVPPVRRRSAYHRSLAGLLARTRSADCLLEGRTRSACAARRGRHPATCAAESILPQRRSARRLEAAAVLSLADHGHRGPVGQGFLMVSTGPQKMRIERPGLAGLGWSHSRFHLFCEEL